ALGDLRGRSVDGLVAERRRLELALDRRGQIVPGAVERAEAVLDVQVRRVAGRVALDSGCRRDQRVGTELADAGVELLVARSKLRNSWPGQGGIRIAEDLGDDPAVVLVVVDQAGQVDQGRPDIRLIDPGA